MSKQTERYELPPKAHHPSDEQHPGADVDEGLFTVGALEQQLRVDFVTHGDNDILEFVDRTIERQRTFEEDHVFCAGPLEERLKDADPFLTDQLQSDRSEKDISVNRWSWYDKMHDRVESEIEKATESIGWQVSKPSEETTFNIHTVTDGSGETGQYTHSEVTPHNLFDGVTDFESLGFTYPFESVVCESSSGSEYVFLPWYGTLICTCHSKVQNWRVPFCKHEVAALLKASKGNFEFDENIDPRFRRLTSREAMLNHTPKR